MAEHLKKASQPKAMKQDDSIMGTNNSSIVSKRSVERLYYPDEPHFFRYFVRKPQRRAPLINRGYWLRMKAIEHVVRQFLEEPSSKPKMVMNLGCGYDPNPWQCLARYPKACDNVTFVDVDYMPLMEKKRDVVKNTIELNEMLTNVSFPESGKILLRSDQYLQLGCDLRELSELTTVLASAADTEKCLILCTAEVSITYMNVEAADALVGWASKLNDARFCLLEQTLPDGPEHPFAKTMLAHFEKLNTPLRAASKYQTIADQEVRFKNAGWKNVQALSLWELWDCPDFLTSAQRMALDDVEPFDEWEEFALFACHYFLLTASNEVYSNLPTPIIFPRSLPENLHSGHMTAQMTYADYQQSSSYRRFGSSLPVRGINRECDLIGDFGGIGLKSRLSSYNIYVLSSVPDQLFHKSCSLEMPTARMCHTITDLGDAGALLVGGRTSPDNGLADCWLHHKWTNIWERVDDLPTSRYRQSAVAIGSGSVLVAGGKSNSRTVLKDFLIWNRRRGWVKCATNWLVENANDTGSLDSRSHNDMQPAIFGGILGIIETDSSSTGAITGILAGGLSQDGLISDYAWIWTLHGFDEGNPSITFQKIRAASSITRFGATLLKYSDRFLIVGGVARNTILKADEEIIMFEVFKNRTAQERTKISNINCEGLFPRPLFIGSSLFCSGDTLVIMGGGALCFSFGAFWNRSCFTLSLHTIPSSDSSRNYQNHDPKSPVLWTWKFLQTIEMVPHGNFTNYVGGPYTLNGKEDCDLISIQRTTLSSASEFLATVSRAKPVILEELDLGSCTKIWTSTYLQDHIGRDNKVVIHQASAEQMDFVSKNFRYVTKPFGEFMEAIDAGEMLYLRSLSVEKPSELPAYFDRDFPTIANDFRLPPELKLVSEKAHSSAFRISGPVNMWLHYDVMANVLCQIRGHKRLLLFPPTDVQHLNFSPGSSSSSMDVFNMLDDAKLAHTHPHEAILRPGDVLFIPALWLHTASPTDRVSVAVNVFFRDLNSGYALGKDVYGNRDLQAYENGRQDVARIARSFSNLPKDTRQFYVLRLAEELTSILDS